MEKSLNGAQGRREFDSGFYCAESALSYVAEKYGSQSYLFPGIAKGFFSEMGRAYGTFGALTGRKLVINLLLGRKAADDSAERNYGPIQGLLHGFTELYGTTNCAEPLGCGIGSDMEKSKFTCQ